MGASSGKKRLCALFNFRDSDVFSKADVHIAFLRDNPTINTAQLGHSFLGDRACEVLFQWLTRGDGDIGRNEGCKQDSQSDDDSLNEKDELSDTHAITPQTRTAFPRSLAYLELNDVGMGDLGFKALVVWLERLQEKEKTRAKIIPNAEEPMKRINLRYNLIHGTAELAQSFVSALSLSSPGSTIASSSLTSLVLTNNPLSSPFKKTLLASLHLLTSLRQLCLSITGLSRVDAGLLAKYISGEHGRCKLVEFQANGNQMKYTGVRAIIQAMRHCWTLERVEMYANGFTGEDDGSDEGDEGEDISLEGENEASRLQNGLSFTGSLATTSPQWATGGGCGWPLLEQILRQILTRNMLLKRQVATQALELLKYSRLMLRSEKLSLKPENMLTESSQTRCSNDCECIPESTTSSTTRNIDSSQLSNASFTFLPTEIQLSILSHLAPLLTSTQRIRIFEHAVDRNTLPQLVLCLPSRHISGPAWRNGCVPDPANLGFNNAGISSRGKKVGQLRMRAEDGRQRTACPSGSCMGSSNTVICQRDTERQKWLEAVGCDAYDPGVQESNI